MLLCNCLGDIVSSEVADTACGAAIGSIHLGRKLRGRRSPRPAAVKHCRLEPMLAGVKWRETIYETTRANRLAVEMVKNTEFWVRVRFGSGSSPMELERCFFGGHLLRINCNYNY